MLGKAATILNKTIETSLIDKNKTSAYSKLVFQMTVVILNKANFFGKTFPHKVQRVAPFLEWAQFSNTMYVIIKRSLPVSLNSYNEKSKFN